MFCFFFFVRGKKKKQQHKNTNIQSIISVSMIFTQTQNSVQNTHE